LSEIELSAADRLLHTEGKTTHLLSSVLRLSRRVTIVPVAPPPPPPPFDDEEDAFGGVLVRFLPKKFIMVTGEDEGVEGAATTNGWKGC
jgi:hypothetical protein